MNMIAKTILEQIGGRRFAAMTGSKDFIDMGNGLRMSLARNKTSANRLDIIYDAVADLYNMRFYRRTFSKKTFECKTKDIETHEGIYCDMLEEMFTNGFGEIMCRILMRRVLIFRQFILPQMKKR